MAGVCCETELFDVQLWFEHYKPLTKDDKDLLETVLESWFCLGRMGGFNSMNLQVGSGTGIAVIFQQMNQDITAVYRLVCVLTYNTVRHKAALKASHSTVSGVGMTKSLQLVAM